MRLLDIASGGPDGLLYEVSQGGCRVSNVCERDFPRDARIRLQVPGFGELEGHVRQTSDGAIAVRYSRPLHLAVLGRLIDACRSADAIAGVSLAG